MKRSSGRIDRRATGVDAATQRLHALQFLLAQPEGSIQRTHAGVADSRDVGLWIELLAGSISKSNI